MIKYETEINGTDRVVEDPDLVDIMKVGGKLRYADQQGESGSLESGKIIGASGKSWKVIIRTPDGNRETRNHVNVIQTNEEGVFLSGKRMVDKYPGSEVIRIRQINA